jgi:hypothetical protein
MSPDLRPFKNSNLFSNHYLEKLIKDSPEWREEAAHAEAFASVKELYLRKARVLENYNESQLEENFIRPVLRLLGRCIEFECIQIRMLLIKAYYLSSGRKSTICVR